MSLKNELQEKKDSSIMSLITQLKPQFKMALGNAIDPDRFVRIAMTSIRSNPILQMCNAQSLLGALMQSAQIQLEPNTPLGFAYIVPKKNKGVWEANFWIGYKGYLRLFYNASNTEFVYAKLVYANDQFSYQFGSMPDIRHKPTSGEKGAITHVYAVAKFNGKTPMFEVMTTDDINHHAKKFSLTIDKSFSPWKSHWEEMAKKTVLLKLLKQCPLSTEQQMIVAQDETIKRYEDGQDISMAIDVTDYTATVELSPWEQLKADFPEECEIVAKENNKDEPGEDEALWIAQVNAIIDQRNAS